MLWHKRSPAIEAGPDRATINGSAPGARIAKELGKEKNTERKRKGVTAVEAKRRAVAGNALEAKKNDFFFPDTRQ